MSSTNHDHEPDWVHGHPHEPNPAPPAGDGAFSVVLPNDEVVNFTVERLQQFPYTEITDCYIVSTGHGTSGPFCFGGVRLLTLLNVLLTASQRWTMVDVHSADGFGARIPRLELETEAIERATLLAWQVDSALLSRQQGLVRLIVPSEIDDALKQVKWVSKIVLK